MFAEAKYCLYSKTQLPPGLQSQMAHADGTLSRFWTMALPRLLYRAATFKQCTDPRDKIYGLLGLAPNKFAHSIKVDYRENNTAADVFRMAVLNHASITLRFEHFHNCFTPRNGRKIPQSPSWVPDWVSDNSAETYVPAQFVATTSRAHYRHSPEDNPAVLNMLGKRFGKIRYVTKALPQGLSRSAAIQRVRQWQPDVLDSDEQYAPTGDPFRTAYAITLNFNGVREREPDWMVSSREEWVQQDFDEALFGGRASASATSPPQDTTAACQEGGGKQAGRIIRPPVLHRAVLLPHRRLLQRRRLYGPGSLERTTRRRPGRAPGLSHRAWPPSRDERVPRGRRLLRVRPS